MMYNPIILPCGHSCHFLNDNRNIIAKFADAIIDKITTVVRTILEFTGIIEKQPCICKEIKILENDFFKPFVKGFDKGCVAAQFVLPIFLLFAYQTPAQTSDAIKLMFNLNYIIGVGVLGGMIGGLLAVEEHHQEKNFWAKLGF